VPEPALCVRIVVSRVSATEPRQPPQNSTVGPLTCPLTWCDVVSGEAPCGPVCRCHGDGMQEARGSNPLSSTLLITTFLQLSRGECRAMGTLLV